jgi:hypothetical protein
MHRMRAPERKPPARPPIWAMVHVGRGAPTPPERL